MKQVLWLPVLMALCLAGCGAQPAPVPEQEFFAEAESAVPPPGGQGLTEEEKRRFRLSEACTEVLEEYEAGRGEEPLPQGCSLPGAVPPGVLSFTETEEGGWCAVIPSLDGEWQMEILFRETSSGKYEREKVTISSRK